MDAFARLEGAVENAEGAVARARGAFALAKVALKVAADAADAEYEAQRKKFVAAIVAVQQTAAQTAAIEQEELEGATENRRERERAALQGAAQNAAIEQEKLERATENRERVRAELREGRTTIKNLALRLDRLIFDLMNLISA
jgi:hypothetical protein